MNTDMKNNFWIIKSVILTSLFLCFNISCNKAQVEINRDVSVVKSPEIQNDKLKDKAAKLSEFYATKNCKEFVNTFPNTFQEFNNLYGYEDGKGGNILYSNPEHIDYFFECSEVSYQEKLDKIVKTGIDGKWDADTTNLFQDSAFELVKSHINEAKEILDKLPNEKAASFWYFLFDGPHPNDKEVVKNFELMRNLLGKNSKQSKLLLAQYQKLKTDWENH